MPEVSAHHDLIDRLSGDPARWVGADRVAALIDIERLRRWLVAREASLLAIAHGQRDDVNVGARDLVQLLQQQAGVGFGEAKRRELRAMWLPRLPAALAALVAGRVGIEQIDALCALADRLDPDERPGLFAAEGQLVDELADLTPPAAKKRLLAFEHDLADDDGERRLEKQRLANSLRLPKNSDGTIGIHGQLDPIAGAELRRAIDAKVAEMWRRQNNGATDFAPPDSVLTNERRRAEALVELIRGASTGSTAGGPGAGAQLLVLIDYQTLLGQLAAGGSTCRLGDGTPIPAAEARRLACNAGIIPAVLGSPSQPLDVGRATRLATGAQRAALRAVYDTCSVKGCDVPFEFCEIHHIDWWRHGGRTDLHNLTPACSKHHHLIHDDGWILHIDPDGTAHLIAAGNRTAQQPASSPAPPARPGASAATAAKADTSQPAESNRRQRVTTPARPAAILPECGREPPGDVHLQPMRC